MIVNEIFYSLQGEGRLAGVPSIFIRSAGCRLRCRWCDTKYAWDAQSGQELKPEQIFEQIRDYPTSFAVITGGEPMEQPDIGDVAGLLHKNGYHVTVETAGIDDAADMPVDLMSISPKLSNSTPTNPEQAEQHEQNRYNADVLNRLIETYDYQLKFVVDSPRDLNEIAECLQQLKTVNPANVYLMPQATAPKEYLEKSRWLAEYCLQTGFAFSPRLQVMLWPGRRGR